MCILPTEELAHKFSTRLAAKGTGHAHTSSECLEMALPCLGLTFSIPVAVSVVTDESVARCSVEEEQMWVISGILCLASAS